MQKHNERVFQKQSYITLYRMNNNITLRQYFWKRDAVLK